MFEWKPPFSLDLTDIDPDILYCVDIFNTTCGTVKHLSSDCDVNETQYHVHLPEPVGYKLGVNITARSNSVRGRPQNGTVFSREGI